MKSSFNRVLIASFFTLAMFSAITYLSCNKDKCKGITCYNGGACNGDTCTCPTGYEGATCTTASRNKFLGEWQAAQKGITVEPLLYPISMATGNAVNTVLINNFNNSFTTPVSANVTGMDNLVIPSQTVQGNTISGTAFYDSNGNIDASYTVTDPSGNTTSVSVVWEK